MTDERDPTGPRPPAPGDGIADDLVDGSVDGIADDFVDALAALDPIEATSMGVPGYDHELTDYSPTGVGARAELARRTLRALERAPRRDDHDHRAARVVEERLRTALDQHDAGEPWRDLRVLGSPLQAIRQVFDLMATESVADWETITRRVEAVPGALQGLRAGLDEGRRRGLTAAARQALGCAEQAATWGGEGAHGDPPFFVGLLDRFDAAGHDDTGLRSELELGARAATRAYGEIARYLREEYASDTDAPDAVGEERYAVLARGFLGSRPDLHEAYAWGWDELAHIERALGDTAARILPDAPLPAVIEHLEADEHRSIDGADAFRGWLQDLLDRSVAELDGVHFDIPEPVRRVEAMIAPPGGAAAMYYTPPSEDFSRPGRTWYPTLGATRFPLWREVSICYHEGVPGHHLQIGQVVYRRDRLNRFQRLLGFTSGHGEGWALYAERLMGELGYLEDPAWELGMLAAQAMRAVRVVVDIGMHLELPIPDDQSYHPGERWTPELALPFVITRSRFPESFMRSEVDRYLGLPGQAISYKLGERVWLDARADARARHGAAFDLRAWHDFALDLGGMGLEQLADELAGF